MDSAPSDSLPKLDTSSTDSALPPSTGPAGAANAGYYQPPTGQSVSEPSAVTPTKSSVPPVSSAQPSGVVPPAPGSLTLGSMPPEASSSPGGPPVVSFESPTRANVPSMGMNSVPGSMPSAAAVPPTVSNEATANQVQERMQAANLAASGKGGKKRSLLLPILGVIVVLAIAATAVFYFWQQSASMESDLPVPDTSVNELTTTTEDNIADNMDFVPAVALSQEELATAEKSQVNGLICSYDDTYQAGKINFFQPLSGVVYEFPVAEGADRYSEMVPVGSYVAIFTPDDEQLPKLAYTEFIDCGLDYDECTDHSLGQFVVAPDSSYDGVFFCDAMYEEDGLPEFLRQNENMREVL